MPRPSIGRRGKQTKIDFAVPRAALEIWRFAGEDDNRHNLSAIHFEAEKIGKSKAVTIHACTTDGHRLLHAWWTAEDSDKLTGMVDVHAFEVRDFLKYAGKTKKGEEPPTFRIAKDGYRADVEGVPEYILSTNTKKSAPVSMAKETEFPQWRHILPPELNGDNTFSHKFGINVEYMVDFGKYLYADGCGYGVVVHYADQDALGPVRFTPGHVGTEIGAKVDVEYILMPMRT